MVDRDGYLNEVVVVLVKVALMILLERVASLEGFVEGCGCDWLYSEL